MEKLNKNKKEKLEGRTKSEERVDASCRLAEENCKVDAAEKENVIEDGIIAKPLEYNITGNKAYFPLTEKEKEMMEEYVLGNSVQYTKIHCTGCNTHLGSALTQRKNVFVHPLLKVIICKKCMDFYSYGAFNKDPDGVELFCRWCGQGGKVFCCDKCPKVFCQACIKLNLPDEQIDIIQNSDYWECFVCDPSPIMPQKIQCYVFRRYVQNELVRLKKLDDTVFYMEMDYSQCCNKSKRQKRNLDTVPIQERLDKKKKQKTDHDRQLNKWEKDSNASSESNEIDTKPSQKEKTLKTSDPDSAMIKKRLEKKKKQSAGSDNLFNHLEKDPEISDKTNQVGPKTPKKKKKLNEKSDPDYVPPNEKLNKKKKLKTNQDNVEKDSNPSCETSKIHPKPSQKEKTLNVTSDPDYIPSNEHLNNNIKQKSSQDIQLNNLEKVSKPSCETNKIDTKSSQMENPLNVTSDPDYISPNEHLKKKKQKAVQDNQLNNLEKDFNSSSETSIIDSIPLQNEKTLNVTSDKKENQKTDQDVQPNNAEKDSNSSCETNKINPIPSQKEKTLNVTVVDSNCPTPEIHTLIEAEPITPTISTFTSPIRLDTANNLIPTTATALGSISSNDLNKSSSTFQNVSKDAKTVYITSNTSQLTLSSTAMYGSGPSPSSRDSSTIEMTPGFSQNIPIPTSKEICIIPGIYQRNICPRTIPTTHGSLTITPFPKTTNAMSLSSQITQCPRSVYTIPGSLTVTPCLQTTNAMPLPSQITQGPRSVYTLPGVCQNQNLISTMSGPPQVISAAGSGIIYRFPFPSKINGIRNICTMSDVPQSITAAGPKTIYRMPYPSESTQGLGPIYTMSGSYQSNSGLRTVYTIPSTGPRADYPQIIPGTIHTVPHSQNPEAGVPSNSSDNFGQKILFVKYPAKSSTKPTDNSTQIPSTGESIGNKNNNAKLDQLKDTSEKLKRILKNYEELKGVFKQSSNLNRLMMSTALTSSACTTAILGIHQFYDCVKSEEELLMIHSSLEKSLKVMTDSLISIRNQLNSNIIIPKEQEK